MNVKSLTKELLFEEYVIKEKSMKQIAKEQGVAIGSVYNYLRKNGINGRRYMTESAREKIRQSHKGKTYRRSYKASEETKRKMSEAQKGRVKKPSKYGGHIKHRKDGYISVYLPDHPQSTKDGYVMEHILAMEKHIGRYLEKDEVVHHINKKRDDNRIENLQLMTFKEHAGLHMKERWAEKKRRENI